MVTKADLYRLIDELPDGLVGEAAYQIARLQDSEAHPDDYPSSLVQRFDRELAAHPEQLRTHLQVLEELGITQAEIDALPPEQGIAE